MPRGALCLRKLREHMVASPGAPPEIVDGKIALGGRDFDASAPTGYVSSRAGVGAYTLEAVVLLLRTARSSEYVKICIQRKIKAVVTTDQADLRSYVTGQSEDSKQLEDDAEAELEVAEAPEAERAEGAPEVSDAEARLVDALGGPDVYPMGCLTDGLGLVPGKDFTFAVQLYDRFRAKEAEEKERAKKLEAREKEREKKVEKRKAEGKPEKPAAPKKPKTARVEAVGIIVVPSAMTSLITILNAADLLERSTFATPQEKRKQGAKKEQAVKISRTMPDGSVQTFKIVDNPQRLSDSDWRRVLAVFAQGAAWQFKGWRVSQPVEVFNKFLGVHLKFDDVDTPPEVKKWNVTVLSINKYKRHLDPTTAVQFWRLMDAFLLRKKAERKAEKAAKALKAGAKK